MSSLQEESTGYAGPAWDNSAEYASLVAPTLQADIDAALQQIAKVDECGHLLAAIMVRAEELSLHDATSAIKAAQTATASLVQAEKLLRNATVFVSCELSVDGRNAEARSLHGKLQSLTSSLAAAYSPTSLFLKVCRDEVVEGFLSLPEAAPFRFSLQQERLLKPHVLSLPEESLLINLGVDGHKAWETLYSNLSGTIECVIQGSGVSSKKVGLATAASMQQDPDENVRRAAYEAINTGWRTHEESCAAAINALAGWRHEVYKRRSNVKPMNYLDTPLKDNRIKRATLDAMFAAVKAALPELRTGLRLQAKLLGKEKLAPWDLQSPCPDQYGGGWKKMTFSEAMDLIIQSFTAISPEMGAFAKMMADNDWIEARVGGAKRPGAYCTHFAKSRTPRVYMTFNGGMREVKTLAHELGHAFHAWVVRDLPVAQSEPPMTLAETASIFAETVVHHELQAKARSPAEQQLCSWALVNEIEGLLINVPSRFSFETAFYDERRQGPVSVQRLKDLMTRAWREWYGDTLTETNDMFWASKLHFYIGDLSFYNFPYVFGHLFALGVFAQRAPRGAGFFKSYVALLRDTGQMTAEDLAQKHLGVDLTKPDFWMDSLATLKQGIKSFEGVAATLSKK